MAAQAVTCGEGDVFVAGGVESMSRAPYVMNKAESAVRPRRPGLRFDDRRALSEPQDRAASSAPTRCPRPPTISRATTRSPARPAMSSPRARRRKYAAGKAAGFFEGEILPVEVPGGRAGPVKVAEDEHPRPQTDMAALAKLRPLQRAG